MDCGPSFGGAPFTIEAFVKVEPESFPQASPYVILSGNNGTAESMGWSFAIEGGAPTFTYYSMAPPYEMRKVAAAESPAFFGVWQHVAVTVGPDMVVLYQKGHEIRAWPVILRSPCRLHRV